MCAFSYTWSLPITWPRWQSHHSISHCQQLHANIMVLCFIEAKLWPIEVQHCENKKFRSFIAPVILTLTRWPSYTTLIRIPWRYIGCAILNFLRRGFRKLSSDRQTDRQTDRHDRKYLLHRFKNHFCTLPGESEGLRKCKLVRLKKCCYFWMASEFLIIEWLT